MLAINPLKVLRQYFNIEIATSEALKDRLYHFRYQVFCQEYRFEREEDCANQQERDIYDDSAIHCIISHRASNEIVGCIRLILPTALQNMKESTSLLLPFEKYTDADFLPENTKPLLRYGEISRLAVHKNFRRRQHDGQNAAGANMELLVERGLIPDRNYPIVSIAMMLSGAALGRIHQVDYLYAMMEPKLSYVLSHYGIYFSQVGKLTNYHGERAPYRVETYSIWDSIRPELKPTLDFLHDSLGEYAAQKRIA